MIQRSYQFRFYPTAVQRVLLAHCFGAARWVWNTALAWRSHCYKIAGETVSGVDFSRELTWLKKIETFAWLATIPATVLTQILRDQDRAFANFFAKRAKYPRFKKRCEAASIRFQLDQRVVMNAYRAGQFLKLSGLGLLDVRWSRVPGGVPKMVTLRRDAAGRYFVSFMVEEAISMSDAALGQLRRQIQYKCHWHGRELLVAERFAPTSKTCSRCGTVQADMPLRIRDWTCPDCGAVHDRDVNAAVNVLMFATGGRPEGHARGGWTIPSAGVQGNPGMLAPDETRTKPQCAGACHG